MARGSLAASGPRAAPTQRALAHTGARLRVARARIGFGLLAWIVLLAGIATGRSLLPDAPRLGLIATHDGRIVLLDPGSPLARVGVNPGDTIVAIAAGTNTSAIESSLRGSGLALLDQTDRSLVTIGLSVGGSYETQVIAPIPSTVELAGGWAALIAALALWICGLVAGLPRRRDPSLRRYALASFALALAVCAAVARDGASFWPWPVLAPALLVGLAALLDAHVSLVTPRPRAGRGYGIFRGALAFVTICAALCAALDAYVALPRAVMGGVAALIGLLAISAIAAPLILHMRAHAEPARRRLRVALLAGLLGLAPPLIWPGVTVAGALLNRRAPLVAGLPIAPLWSAAGLIPMAALYGALAAAPAETRDAGALAARRLDSYVRAGLSLALAVALCAGALVVAWVEAPLGMGGRIALVAGVLILFPFVQRAVESSIQRGLSRPRPDYDGALRLLEDLASAETTTGELARAVVTRLPALLQAHSATLLLRDAHDPPGEYRVVTRDTVTAHPSPPHPDTAVRLDDETLEAAGRPLVHHDAPFAAPRCDAPGRAGLAGPALWAPLRWNGALRGALVIGPRLSGDPFDDHDVDGAANVAGLLALGLQTLDLVGSLRERTDTLVSLTHRLSHAHEQERAHLSRELHDVVAQELIALTRQLRRYGDGATPPPAIWSDMLAAAQDALTATRRICNGLRPAILDLGLVPALRDLVSDASERGGETEVSITVVGTEQRLPGDREFALFRVAQEGLSNALEHAEARQIRVEALFDGAVVLRVRDDGRGFAVPERFEDFPGDHLGLIGMRERLAEFGGALSVTSTPGRGTVLEACVPL